MRAPPGTRLGVPCLTAQGQLNPKAEVPCAARPVRIVLRRYVIRYSIIGVLRFDPTWFKAIGQGDGASATCAR